LAKIAVDSEAPKTSELARGEGWRVSDVVCTSGPSSRPFEEKHARPAIAIVVSGTFQYRSASGLALMTPGAVLLGNTGQSFECSHEHGTGDRCVSFAFEPGYFDRLMADAGGGRSGRGFQSLRIPPIRVLSPLIARASTILAGREETSWEEFAIRLAAHTVQLDRGVAPKPISQQPGDVARVSRVVRMLEAHPEECHDLGSLAREVRLSPYHFLRTFESVAGATPHQYLLRMRLRRAAVKIRTGSANILEIALDCGFGDVSNFNRAFRGEFGVSPRAYRQAVFA
jgi:AraC family transcriptional regulator